MKRQVQAVADVDLAIDPAPLPWERANAAAIDAHWARATAENLTLFDGTVYLVSSDEVAGGSYRAICHAARFATLTYWRNLGMPRSGFFSFFGNLILRGACGGLLMAETAEHTATGGMRGFPGGAFDPGDAAGGRLDATGCCLRECTEETGFGPADLDLAPGFIVYRDHQRHALSRIGRLALGAEEARAQVLEFLETQDQPELAEIFIVRDRGDLDRIDPHPYSRAVATWILDND